MSAAPSSVLGKGPPELLRPVVSTSVPGVPPKSRHLKCQRKMETGIKLTILHWKINNIKALGDSMLFEGRNVSAWRA